MSRITWHIQQYIDLVRSGVREVCKTQLLLCDYIDKVFREEDIYVDEGQADKYLKLQKWFPYKLLPWEVFCFVLHNCVYFTDTNMLRWPELLIYVGRGAGKNGYLSFEDFALLTPINGVRNYDIDIFATSEDQSAITFNDIREDVLEQNRTELSRYFRWNKEEIRNIKTNSVLRFNTSAPRTKDGRRPGKVDFDEYHAYENHKLIDVAVTGLGKKKFSRKTIISTDGLVRDGPLDRLKERSRRILNLEEPDNGLLPFLCSLDSMNEIDDELMWHKANPSLYVFPDLMAEMKTEYVNYLSDKIGNVSFAVKRMNMPMGDLENEVTSWENILACSRPIPEYTKDFPCVFGLDYASTTDFVSAGTLTLLDDESVVWYQHSWVCRQCSDLSRIRAPLDEWERKGILTFVDDVDINPELIADWLSAQGADREVIKGAMDMYRWRLVSKSLERIGFDANKNGRNNVALVRPSDRMLISPQIASYFSQKKIIMGDDPMMRWYINNAKKTISTNGNIDYGKIEPKTRKTDGFMAFVAAMTQLPLLESRMKRRDIKYCSVWTY